MLYRNLGQNHRSSSSWIIIEIWSIRGINLIATSLNFSFLENAVNKPPAQRVQGDIFTLPDRKVEISRPPKT